MNSTIRANPAQARVASQKARVVAANASLGQKAAAVALPLIMAGSANALTYDEIQGLTYNQLKGTGLGNTCPVIEAGTTDLKQVKSGNYTFDKFCLEPTSFKVKEESQFKGKEAEFAPTKLVTRLTYTLEQMTGKVSISGNQIKFQEEDGIDYAPTTVQLAGGERVPFLFTARELNASGSLDNFAGNFKVASYRGSSFLDPKGRGGSTGYDTTVSLPTGAGDDEELAKENIKSAAASTGSMVLSTAKYDPETGEIAGVFESIQPSDTDLGSRAPKDIKITGLWYARLTKA